MIPLRNFASLSKYNSKDEEYKQSESFKVNKKKSISNSDMVTLFSDICPICYLEFECGNKIRVMPMCRH